MRRTNKSLSLEDSSDRVFYEVLAAKLDMENELDVIKTELLSTSKCNLVDLFQELDPHKLGRVGRAEIEGFFRNVALNVNTQEVEAILRYFTDLQSIDFNSFFLKLLPHTGRTVPKEDSSVQELLSKLFLAIIEYSEEFARTKQNMGVLESTHLEKSCKDKENFTIYDLESLFKKYGGWPITGENVRVIFGKKLRLKRADICALLSMQYKQNTVNSSLSRKEMEDTSDHDSLLRSGSYGLKQKFSNSFFDQEVKFFADMTITEREREMLFD